MNEDDCFMSDTLDNFIFNDKSKNGTISEEISFDDSSFLEKLSLDLEKLEEDSRLKPNIEGILKENNENIKKNVCLPKIQVAHSSASTKTSRANKTSKICTKNSSDAHDTSKYTSKTKKIKTDYLTQHFDASTSGNYNLSSWGLPDIVLEKYKQKKIEKMFPWQFECLNSSKVLGECSNLIYSAPTSAGKTLVAEILALKTIFERNKKVICILPFVSIVREKMYYFQDILGCSGIRAEGFMGSYNPPGGFSSVQFAICTIEKANSLVNKLLEEKRLSEVGCLLVDEMHLLGDPYRGYLLELLLTKIRYIALKDTSLQIQIIGMSATLPNLNQLAEWLGAELYSTSFRPIPLLEQASICGEIYDKNFCLTKKLEPLPEVGVDTDNVLQLCLETIKDSCSVLIFCPTKNWCESLAQQLSLAFFKIGNSHTSLGELLKTQIKSNLILEVLEQLRFCPVGVDMLLRKTVSFGVAFHHAGLTMDERDIIEGAFRNGAVKILVATSTLSSGVNLPARRVLIRSPKFCGKPIDILTYRQMIGRAGRLGKDTKGESFLICQKSDCKIAKELMSGDLPPVKSCLEGDGKLKRAILEVIASGVASSPDDVALFTNCTLLAASDIVKNNLQNPIDEAIEFLTKHEFIRLNKLDDNVEKYVATSLGKACLSSSIAPDEGLTLFTELEKARQCFVLETELHLIYLVTPYGACYSWGNIDWMFFLDLWDKLPSAMKRVGELVGVREAYIVNATRRNIDTSTSKAYQKMMVHKRFFVALALQDLVNEVPLGDVCAKFSCNRGMLQSLQQSASTFAGMVTSFSRQLGWSSVELLLSQFQDRMQFGVSRDLLDLMRIPSLNGRLARTLYNAGIETIIQLANSDLDTVESVLCRAGPFESSKEREGESEVENKQRNKLKKVWITGKEGLTEREAAELLVKDARRYLEIEMGLKEAKWKSQSDNNSNANKSNNSVDILIDTSLTVIRNSTKDASKDAEGIEIISSPTAEGNSIENTSKDAENLELSSLNLSSSISNNSVHRQSNTGGLVVEVEAELQIQNTKVDFKKDTIIEPSGEKSLLEMSSTSSLFSDISFTRLENNLQLDVEKPQKLLDMNLSSLEIGISDSSVPSSARDSVGIEEGLANKSHEKESLAQTIDDFDSEGIFETAMQNIDFTQEIVKNCLRTVESNTETLDITLRYKRMRKKSETSSEESFLLATPTKKVKISDAVTPFSSTIKKYSRLSLKDDETDFSKIHIVKVCSAGALVETFYNELKSKLKFSFSLACTKIVMSKPIIGANILAGRSSNSLSSENITFNDKKVEGFAFCWGGTESYYLSVENCNLETIQTQLKNIFTDKQRYVRMFDAKNQIKTLSRCCGIEFACSIEDPKIADWLLEPEGREKSLQNMITRYCKDLNEIGQLCGKVNSVTSLGLNADSVTESKIRASVDAISSWHLIDTLKKELQAKMPELNKTDIKCFPTNYELEMRIQLCLANMELCGMSSDKLALQGMADLLKTQQNSIERRAYSLAGRRFNFSSSTDVSKVIGTFRGKKVSTRKQVLEQNEHPISNLVLLWRKINFTLIKMVYPLLRACDNGRIYGIYVTHTATGRITMHEPNIQMVTKNFSMPDPISKKEVLISCRSAFKVPEGYIMVAADYCQLELRILTFLSKDRVLTGIMNKPGDIFRSIAAKWNRISEEMVEETTRQHTKQICYAIIYGMGAKALAEQMVVSEEVAMEFMETFHIAYPGIKSFIKRTVDLCREKGYVETITGRRRYLPHINHTDLSVKAQAERQAANTKVQGSAADIVKNAMVTIEDKMELVFKKTRYKPKLTLHLHDELIYEVPEKYLAKAVKIIRKGMENSASGFGCFPVKVKTGKSWGELNDYVDKNV